MKAIELFVESKLPEDLRPEKLNLDGKGVEALLAQVARKRPEIYGDLLKHLADAGRHAAYRQGETLTLNDLRPVLDMKRIYASMDKELAQARSAFKDDAKFEQERERIWLKYSDNLEKETLDASERLGTGLAYAVASGARGKAAQLKAMVSTPGVYQDSMGRTVPIFVRHSFSQGLRPYEHLAGSYGARHSVVSTKRCLHELTLVKMADGAHRAIQFIKPGDMVMGASREGTTFPVKVLNNFNQGKKRVWHYAFAHTWKASDVRSVICTPDHKFVRSPSRAGYRGKVKPISKFGPDDHFLTADDDVILTGSTELWDVTCHDLEVDHPEHLFVLANGLIVSNSTAKGGDFSKQMGQAAATLMVTEDDCGVNDGVDVAVGDDSKLRVLARPIAGLSAGTILDRDAIGVLRRKNVDNVIVRSALTCRAGSGICAECAGADARGILPPIGEMIGITAANAIGEPITQAALSTKHTAGQASGKKRFSGFDYLNQLVQAPEVFKDRAPVAERGGRVTKVEDAPQGGRFVFVDDEPHYVLPDQNLEVKVGDEVEAGDALSDGLVDPRDVVRLRGLGEGRRYMAERLKQMLDDSGVKTELRYTEMIARSALDHVNLDDADEENGIDGLPDDTISYERVARQYIPPKDAARLPITGKEPVVGKYLASPAMHLTIGTKLTPRMLNKLRTAGFDEVTVQSTPPPFTPDMVRLRAATHSTDDWLARMNSSYLTRGLGESAVRGEDTDTQSNSHWAPRLAIGDGFGKDVRTTGKF